MRKIRHLEQCDYIIPISQKIDQLLTLSNQSNCYLERTWDKKDPVYALNIHAKFNSDLIEGFRIQAGLFRDGSLVSSYIESFDLYITDGDDYDKTFIASFTPVQVGQYWEFNVSQSLLDPLEATGAETFYIECKAQRKRKSYKACAYFNHIGVFDSIFRLKNKVTFLDLTKADE